MSKTDKQSLLEVQRGRDIRQILPETLERFRGYRNLMVKVAEDLDVSVPTLYTWCRELEIDIDSYRSELVTVKELADA